MFAVQPDAVDALAAGIDDLASDVTAARDYADRHLALQPPPGPVPFGEICGVLEQTRQALGRTLAHLTELCSASAAELHASAAGYRRTDRGQAARLDATYPAGPR
jgi:Excreted virulence factor EspC, type VII ESX diderm